MVRAVLVLFAAWWPGWAFGQSAADFRPRAESRLNTPVEPAPTPELEGPLARILSLAVDIHAIRMVQLDLAQQWGLQNQAPAIVEFADEIRREEVTQFQRYLRAHGARVLAARTGDGRKARLSTVEEAMLKKEPPPEFPAQVTIDRGWPNPSVASIRNHLAELMRLVQRSRFEVVELKEEN